MTAHYHHVRHVRRDRWPAPYAGVLAILVFALVVARLVILWITRT